MIQVPETRSDVQTRSTLRSRVLAAMGSLLIVMSLGAPIPALAEGNPAGAATKLAFVGQLANSGPGAPIIDSTCGRDDAPSVTCLGVAVEDANGAPCKVEVTPSVFARGRPNLGDYIVIYDDGYKSWSPAKTFEDGYARHNI